jgi:chorismate synthase
MKGSEHNDLFEADTSGQTSKSGHATAVKTSTNRHGGMLGGITTGMPIVLRAAVKPTSSLPRKQPTVNDQGKDTTILTRGRHDPCLLPRFVPMAEAMVAIVLADHWLRWKAQCGEIAPAGD